MNDRWDDEWEMTHPTMIEVGTMSCYFSVDELEEISRALNDRAIEYAVLNQNRTMSRIEFKDLQMRVIAYIKQYERRMKDAT